MIIFAMALLRIPKWNREITEKEVKVFPVETQSIIGRIYVRKLNYTYMYI